MHCPLVIVSPQETAGMQLETSTIPTAINATLPRAELRVLMIKTWRVAVQLRKVCELSQLLAWSSYRLGFCRKQAPSMRQECSMTPLTGACHWWQHQGLRYPWQTVPPTKYSSTISFRPCLPASNMSYREYRFSLSQNQSTALTLVAGRSIVVSGLFYAAWTMILGSSSPYTGLAFGAKSRVNQSFQLLNPKQGSFLSQMKSSQLTRAMIFSLNSPPYPLWKYSKDLSLFRISPYLSSRGLNRALKSVLAKTAFPCWVFMISMSTTLKGVPTQSEGRKEGGVWMATFNSMHIWDTEHPQSMAGRSPVLQSIEGTLLGISLRAASRCMRRRGSLVMAVYRVLIQGKTSTFRILLKNRAIYSVMVSAYLCWVVEVSIFWTLPMGVADIQIILRTLLQGYQNNC